MVKGCTRLCALVLLLWLLGFAITEFFVVSSNKSPSSEYNPFKRIRPLDLHKANEEVAPLNRELEATESENKKPRNELTTTKEKLNTKSSTIKVALNTAKDKLITTEEKLNAMRVQ